MSRSADRQPGRAKVSPDRTRVSTQRMWAMAALSGAMLWAALGSLSTSGSGRLSGGLVLQAAAVCAALAVFGLRSIPLRWIVRGVALFSGILLARFGQLGASEGLSGSWRVLLWLTAVGAALTFAPSSRSVAGIEDDSGRAFSVASETRGRIPAAIALACVSLVAGAALIGGPRVSNWFPSGSSAGDLIDRSDNRENNVLVARESLDMTSRPRLSDRVVMTVRSPIATFWRAELFDTWDGTSWTRSYQRAGTMLEEGRVTPALGDVAARSGVETTQQFRLESGFATVLPTAASPVRVDSALDLAQRPDGTIVSPYSPLGSGAAYTVRSRQMNLDSRVLRAGGAGEVSDPDAVEREQLLVDAQYAQTPHTSDRVRELALKVTAGAGNDFDRILAIERWMSRNTTYSLDAPLSPRGVDVVDHFLFEQTEGWCEQIASSLVVMARVAGIPARLATGYAPGEWDSAGRRFVVRERDAHAWAEVWFPGSGWVPFDPTASVPLSGTDAATAGAQARDWREILGMALLAVGIVSLGAAPVTRLVRRVFAILARHRSARREANERWEVRAAQRLEQVGAAAGRPRGAFDSLTRYGGLVAETVGDDRYEEVGQILDRVLYRDGAPDPEGALLSGGVLDRDGSLGAEALLGGRDRERVEELLSPK